MSKHTPGPWEATKGNHAWFISPIGKGFAVAATGSLGSEADARLVAAAPQLLETVRVIRAMCMEFSDDGPGVGRADAADEILRRIAEHAAIAIAATHAPISFDAAEKGVEG